MKTRPSPDALNLCPDVTVSIPVDLLVFAEEGHDLSRRLRVVHHRQGQQAASCARLIQALVRNPPLMAGEQRAVPG